MPRRIQPDSDDEEPDELQSDYEESSEQGVPPAPIIPSSSSRTTRPKKDQNYQYSEDEEMEEEDAEGSEEDGEEDAEGSEYDEAAAAPNNQLASTSRLTINGHAANANTTANPVQQAPPPTATSVTTARMTARQRAKEYGGDGSDALVSLPMIDDSKRKKKVLTEAEEALKRSENSRKRKAQVDRKLEEEKQETINRLLKKQVSRKGNTKSGAATGAENASGVATPLAGTGSVIYAPPLIPTMIRYVSSVKTGEFIQTLSMPLGSEAKFSKMSKSSQDVRYPGPRPPPPTRILSRPQQLLPAR